MRERANLYFFPLDGRVLGFNWNERLIVNQGKLELVDILSSKVRDQHSREIRCLFTLLFFFLAC